MPSAFTMMRSANVCLVLLRQNPQNYEVRRMWQKVIPAAAAGCACPRLLHVSNHQLKDESDSTGPKTARLRSEQQLKDEPDSAQPMTTRKLLRPEKHVSSRQFKHDSDSPTTSRKLLRSEQVDSRLKSVNSNTKKIVINVAKSMPGDWSKTADELLNRLMMSENTGPSQSQAAATEESEDKPHRSLLDSMNIARPMRGTFQHRQQDTTREVREARADDDSYRLSPFRSSSRRVARRQYVDYTELFGAPRLGIFDAEKLKKEAGEQQPASIKADDDLWVKMDKERVRRILGGVPRNSFEEMIQWTKEGKLWKFPIDNEADMEEERKYKFHQHIFLDEHLTQFPDKGPIRKFMELVTLGLSRNPWLTVPEKVEHIQWFAQYFREKQSILEAAIGEQGKIKEGSGQLEGGK